MSHIVAIDLGGTNTKFGLVTKDLKVVDTISIPTEGNLPPEEKLKQWLEIITKWQSSTPINLIGIGIPGPLDTEQGIILESPNLKNWVQFSFTDFFKKNLELDCYIENDGNCAALGEWAAEPVSDLVVLTLGTGVGSGVISNNSLVRGVGGLAVEAGHITIDINGPRCNCGKNGCLEVFVGGRALVSRYEVLTQKSNCTPFDIFKKAQEGEKTASDMIESWTQALAAGIGSLINVFNPKQVRLTGGVSSNFSQVEDKFSKFLLGQAFKHSIQYCEVVLAKQQNYAGLIGAALWAQQSHERRKMS